MCFFFVISLFVFGCRFSCLSSKCSITNTDVHLEHVTSNEDQGEGGSSTVVEHECPVPIKLKSDILETESLNLLSKATFVDTLLTALPVGYFPQFWVFLLNIIASPILIFLWFLPQVLSEEEQHALAATPAHPAGLYGEMFFIIQP